MRHRGGFADNKATFVVYADNFYGRRKRVIEAEPLSIGASFLRQERVASKKDRRVPDTHYLKSSELIGCLHVHSTDRGEVGLLSVDAGILCCELLFPLAEVLVSAHRCAAVLGNEPGYIGHAEKHL